MHLAQMLTDVTDNVAQILGAAPPSFSHPVLRYNCNRQKEWWFTTHPIFDILEPRSLN